jgi:arylformamidase
MELSGVRDGYKQYSSVELDRQYDARSTVEDLRPFLDEYASYSREARARVPCALDVGYGAGASERLDIYRAGDCAPAFIFVHGGYWRALGKADSAFMAKCFAQYGVSTVAVEYSLAPAVSLDEIVRQVRTAVAWVWRNGARYGLDVDRIYIGGSSAGGHLAGMVLACGWHDAYGVPEDLVKGGVVASGLFDLSPVRLTRVNGWMRLDAAAVARNSPIDLLPPVGVPLIVTYGGSETDEFKRQSRAYALAWLQRGYPIDHFEMAACNHYNIITQLVDGSSLLTRKTLLMIDGSSEIDEPWSGERLRDE